MKGLSQDLALDTAAWDRPRLRASSTVLRRSFPVGLKIAELWGMGRLYIGHVSWKPEIDIFI